MVYAICYCPLSRLEDLEALKVAGEHWGASREGVPGHGHGWVQTGGGKQELGEPAPPLLSNPPPRLKDPVGERAGQALCENGGGRGLCGLGTGRAVSKPHLYQHAWAVRGPGGWGRGSGGGATRVGWKGWVAGTKLTGFCPPPQGEIQPERPLS